MFLDNTLSGWRRFVNAGYQRYRLAALLNIIGVKLININFYWCARWLIRVASFINPKYGYLDTFSVMSVSAWCKRHEANVTVVSSQETLDIQKPKFINEPIKAKNIATGKVMLPDAYLAELDDVTVFGGTELILSTNDYVLYDELVLAGEQQYGNKVSVVLKNKKNKHVLLKVLTSNRDCSDAVIHFCKSHSSNYFHWLIECLPRLWIIEQFPELRQLPLLIDAKLFPQQLEALQMLNVHQHPLLELESGMAYQCRKVFYPSQLSVVHDNYSLPVSFSDDVIYSPRAIHYIRNFFLGKIDSHKLSAKKKLFIVRKSKVRSLVNTEEVWHFLSSKGFEAVYPEKLSFLEQVQLFAQAEMIVGQSGAGMANIIFAPEKTRVIMMMNDNPQTNYYIFNILADLCGLDLQYVLGVDKKVVEGFEVHNDFEVDIDVLRRVFE